MTSYIAEMHETGKLTSDTLIYPTMLTKLNPGTLNLWMLGLLEEQGDSD